MLPATSNPQTVSYGAKDTPRSAAIPKLPLMTGPNETSISEIRDVDVLSNLSVINGGRGNSPRSIVVTLTPEARFERDEESSEATDEVEEITTRGRS
jgi:hypothetical protein